MNATGQLMPNIGAAPVGKFEISDVTNIAALRAINTGRTTAGADSFRPAIEDGSFANVLGYTAKNDGGGGVFVFDAYSVVADDNGITIAPTNGMGRWIRQVPNGNYTAEMFGVDGVADDVEINAALAASSNLVQLAATTYNITATLAVAGKTLRGMGRGVTVLNKTTAGYAISVATNAFVSDLKIIGSAGVANGGIDISNSSLATVSRVRIENLTNAAAVAIRVDTSYRTLLEGIYINANATGITLNNVTTLDVVKCSINNCTVCAVTGAGNQGSGDILFQSCDIESNYVTPVITFDGGNSQYRFCNCHFEDNGTGAAPVLFKLGANDLGEFNACNFSEFKATVTGARIDLQCTSGGHEAQRIAVNNCQFIQNNTMNGGTRRFINSLTTLIFSSGNKYRNVDTTLSGVMGTAIWADATYNPPVISLRDIFVGNNGTDYRHQIPIQARKVTEVVSVGAAETDLMTSTLYSRNMQATGALRIIAAGITTGAAGNKTIKFYFGATSFTLGTYAGASDWRAEILVMANADYGTQKISFAFYAGAVLVGQAYGTAAIDTTNDTTIKLTGTCANAADTIKHEMLTVERI